MDGSDVLRSVRDVAPESRLSRLVSTLDAARRIGAPSIIRLLGYRFALRTGLHRRRLPIGEAIIGPFFSDEQPPPPSRTRPTRAFGYVELSIDDSPSWLADPFASGSNGAGKPRTPASRHWSDVRDFDPSSGDIKKIWELSRFDWAPRLALAAASDDEGDAAASLEARTAHWCRINPPNAGPNWKCGQETGLRAMNLLLSHVLLHGADAAPRPGLARLLSAHATRILPTTAYAVAQQNNHGTSEAAALFCLGVVLTGRADVERELARRCLAGGRALIEDRVRALVMADGSFSQNSVTYHRLMLETLCVAELFRRRFGERPFSEPCLARLAAATRWLDALRDEVSGDVPNLGSNDGADFGNVGGADYRNFSPTVARASALFVGARATASTEDALLRCFGVDTDSMPETRSPSDAVFPDGGYAKIGFGRGRGHALLRLPKYRFRPGHSDGNHLDVWFDGVNVTRDDGSYCYNPDDPALRGLFSGTAGHCTVEFDGRDQMPRVSRFLRSRWLRPTATTVDLPGGVIGAAYVDFRNARHDRRVERTGEFDLRVIDVVEGFESEAVLRWRLPAWEWRRSANGLSMPDVVTLTVECDRPCETAFGEALESRRYLQTETVTELAITVREPCRLVTRLSFGSASERGEQMTIRSLRERTTAPYRRRSDEVRPT